MHYTDGQTRREKQVSTGPGPTKTLVQASCGELVPKQFVTGIDSLVKCGSCKADLRRYREHFPQGHADRLQGGRR